MITSGRIQYITIDDILELTNSEIYEIFGTRLERIVIERTKELRLKLKTIWRCRKWYAFKDTLEQFDNETMKMYFENTLIKKYSLIELEEIIDRINEETIYSNPKKNNHVL